MASTDTTCWTLIRGAAGGEAQARREFARLYRPVVAAYLGARWHGTPLVDGVDDATQDVFVECFRDGGVLERADSKRPGGFRAFLFGVTRNIALREETRRARRREVPTDGVVSDLEGQQTRASVAFDRAWARSVMRQAARIQEERARAVDDAAVRRVELLRLRFQDDLPIREIARSWDEDAARLHHEYARARREFRAALKEAISFHHPGSDDEIDAECARLLELLG